MKKKLLLLLVWIVFTGIYCWMLSDIGRSIGSNANSAIEKYAEMMVEYGGTTTDIEHLGSAMSDMSTYRMFNNLSEEYKINFLIIGIMTVVYMTLTVTCYHFAFANKNKIIY